MNASLLSFFFIYLLFFIYVNDFALNFLILTKTLYDIRFLKGIYNKL